MKSIKILNQRIDDTSLDEVIFLIKKSVKEKNKNLFFALNINILILLKENPLFKKKHEKLAKVIFLDGVPLIWLINLVKKRKIKRVAGTDLTGKILEDKSLKIFLLGSTDQVLKDAKSRYPSVCGYYSPPFNDSWVETEKQKIINKINKSKANVLLVAVGPLKQEKWLVDNFNDLNCFVGVGVGSALEILTGKVRRAPELLKNNGFEWLWRLYMEPKRLFKRYLFDFFKFIKLVTENLF